MLYRESVMMNFNTLTLIEQVDEGSSPPYRGFCRYSQILAILLIYYRLLSPMG